MHEAKTRRKSLFLVSILLASVLFISPSTASPTQVSTFANNASSLTIQSDGNNTSLALEIDLERNVTYQDASFLVDSTYASPTPGSVFINNSQGNTVWTYSGQGYGDLSHQNSFQTGNTYDSVQLNNSTGMPSPILLPKNASLQTSQMNVTYTPNIEAQFVQVGSIQQMEMGNSNNDSMADAFVFSTQNYSTGVGTGFAVVESNATSMTYSLTNWTATCATSERIRIADMNNDSFDDVITFEQFNETMCIHYYNSTSSTYDAYFTVNITTQPIDVQLSDLNGDNYSDFISVHGYFGNGLVAVNTFDATTNSSKIADSANIYKWNFWDGRAELRSLHVGDFFAPNRTQTIILVSDDENDATELTYDAITKTLNPNINKFRNLSALSVSGDVDGDGDTDFITPQTMGSNILLNNGQTWTQVQTNDQIFTDNATIADHDNDGLPSFFLPDPGFADNNPATLEGNIGFRSIGVSGVGIPTLNPLTPWSQPRDIYFDDLDGDGLMEQFILAGEATQGIFIGAWHNLSLDVDVDSNIDLSIEGYSSSTISDIGVLTLSDTNDIIRDALSPRIPAYPGLSDGYGIEMVSNMMSISSNSNGTANLTDLDIAYDIEFHVATSSGTLGSLSNSLNQQMLPGTGSFTVILPVETSKAGTFDVTSFSGNYTLGAPDLALPPTPIVSVESLTENHVTIEWQPLSTYGSDLQAFQIFKMSSSTNYDWTAPHDIVIGSNNYTDTQVEIGSTYGYVVRSTHTFGVISNLSQSLSVTIPYPAAPESATNVQLLDLDASTESNPLRVSWTSSVDSFVEEYLVYVSNTSLDDSTESIGEFTSEKNFKLGDRTYLPVAALTNSTTSYDISVMSDYTDSSGSVTGNSIEDASQYWVAIAAVDIYDNASLPLPFAGPTVSFNNTYLQSNLDITVTTGNPDQYLVSNQPLKIEIDASVEDGSGFSPLANAQITLAITVGNEVMNLTGTTDSNGEWTPIDATTLGDASIPTAFLTFSSTYGETLSLHAAMANIEPTDVQPILGSSAQLNMSSGIDALLSGPTSIDKDSNDAIDLNITLTANDVNDLAQQNSLEGTTIHWTAFNESDIAINSGTETISLGKIRVVSEFENATYIQFNVSTDDRNWFGTLTHTTQLNAYVDDSIDNETTTNTTEPVWVPSVLLPATVTCESSTILTNKKMDSDPIECQVNNPNPFLISVELTATDIPALFNKPSTVTIAANGSATISFEPTYDQIWNAQKDESVVKTLGFSIYTTSPDYNSLQPLMTSDTVEWTASLDVPVEPTNTDGDDKESSNTILYGGIGGVLLVLVILGYVMLNRRAGAGFDDDEFYGDDDEFPMEKKEPAPEIPEGKPLDEFEDKTINAEPEIIERPGDSLISELSGSDSNETIEEHEEPEPEESIEESVEEDDGISVDEYGTEWWEDENGTWWYREEGAEDWSEFTE
tara:strand:+ start:492 stop:4802 length:4311 start_codon:yes stop_codon:yes gene_type:complete